MSNFAELNVKDQLDPENANIIPSGEAVLSELGIEPTTLKSIKPYSKRSQYKAVVNWITRYKPAIDASNFEKVRGLIEAFYHLSEVRDWNAATELASLRLSTPTIDSLHRQLLIWGYYPEIIQFHTQLLDLSIEIHEPKGKKSALINLGNAYNGVSKYSQAIECYQKALTIIHEIGDRKSEGNALLCLSAAYLSSGKYVQAIECCQNTLKITCELGDRRS
jgi:tetratricopeptide (TPR) repeat protein